MAIRPVLSGVADTAVGKLPGSSPMGLHAEAALKACADAGLALRDIDGVLCAYSIVEPHPMLSSVFCEYMGIQPAYNSGVQAGGASGAIMVMNAAALVASGQCRHVLVVCGDNRATGMSRDIAVAALAEFGHAQFERPYGIAIYAAYAMVAQRYLHEYGATMEQLAHIAVQHRAHAARHPQAHKREPLSLEDVLASRVIATPLRLYDCCLVSDGAAAIIVSAADAARDLARRPVEILGMGQGHTHEHISEAPSLTEYGCARAAATAFGQAGVGHADIDVAEIYDSFTITLLIELESIGFFEKGEAGHAAARGDLTHGGRLPCNTHGGLLSYGHSGAAGGMFHLIEAVRQLRGEADARQVPDAELAFVHGDGGILSAHCSMILGRG